MPIGYQAISREEVKELLEFYSGRQPSKEQINRANTFLKQALDKTRDDILKDQAKTMASISQMTSVGTDTPLFVARKGEVCSAKCPDYLSVAKAERIKRKEGLCH